MRSKNLSYSRLSISARNQQISEMLEYAPRGNKGDLKKRLNLLWRRYEGLDDFTFFHLQRIAKAGRLEEGLTELERYYQDTLREACKWDLLLRVGLGRKAVYFIDELAKKLRQN